MSDAPISGQDTAGDRPSGPVPQGSPSGSPTENDVAAEDARSSTLSAEELEEEELEISELEAQLLEDMDRLQSERNDYLDQLLRTRADFDNYRKRILKQQSEHQERAAESLVVKLLDALDRLQSAVKNLKSSLKGNDMGAIRSDTEALMTVNQGITTRLYSEAASDGQGDAGGGDFGGDDEVVDAEIVDEQA